MTGSRVEYSGWVAGVDQRSYERGGLSVSMSQYGVQGDMAHLESLKMYIVNKVFSAFSPSHSGEGGGGGRGCNPHSTLPWIRPWVVSDRI